LKLSRIEVSRIRYVSVSITSGVLFAIMDGLINANPYAQTMYEAYGAIMKTEVDMVSGITIDVAYGFIMVGVFLYLYAALPGTTGPIKGAGFGIMVWFFRVVMSVASAWMMFNVPASLLIYTLAAGLAEMLVLGIFLGLNLNVGEKT